MTRSCVSSLVLVGLTSALGCTSLGTWNSNFLTPPAAQQPQKISMATPNRYATVSPAPSQPAPSVKKEWNKPTTWFAPKAPPAQTSETEGFAHTAATVAPSYYPAYNNIAPPYQEGAYQVAAYSPPPVPVVQTPVAPAVQQPALPAPIYYAPPVQTAPTMPVAPPPAAAVPANVSAELMPKPLPDAANESPIALVAYTTSGQDEYLVSGGDSGGRVRVNKDWTVTQLAPEDTVAHFDTVDGKVVVVPSDRVAIYAPRFRSVRVVEGVQQDSQRAWVAGNTSQIAPYHDERRERAGLTSQETQSLYARHQSNIDQFGNRAAPSAARANTATSGDANFESVMSYNRALTARRLDGETMAALVRGNIMAQAWAGNESVRVRIHQLAATSVSDAKSATSTFAIEQGESRSILQFVKVADRDAAHPGDLVEFTLRFDNLGNKPIGNVTIIDSLTSRLELVEGSAEASLAAGFLTERNDAGSLILRWEITDPLRPLEYGVIRFKCRVL